MNADETLEILGALSLRALEYDINFSYCEEEAYHYLLAKYLILADDQSEATRRIKKGIDLLLFLIHESLGLEIEQLNFDVYKLKKIILKKKR